MSLVPKPRCVHGNPWDACPRCGTCRACTPDVPCLKHVDAVSEAILRTPEAMRADLANIPSDVDMAGPDE